MTVNAWTKDEVRRAAAEVLGVEPGSLTDGGNLIGHGMDSIRMMKLVGGWRRAGAEVTFRDLARTPTVEDWYGLLTAQAPAAGAAAVAVAPGPGEGREPVDPAAPFALTPVQRAYWVGRAEGMALGGVGCHAYLELDGSAVDPGRLEAAVRRVLERHGMLRAAFLADGRQQILPESPWKGLTVHDFSASGEQAAAAGLEEVRAALSHRVFDVASAEVFDVQMSLLPGGRTRVHLGIDLLVADVASIELVLDDLAVAYSRPGELAPAPGYGFPDYLRDHRAWCGELTDPDSPLAAAREFWRGRIPSMPVSGPRLPLAVQPGQITAPRFSRRSFLLGAAEWERITLRAREAGLTAAMVLATAYAEVLGAWSETPHFLLNVPLFDRQPIDPAVGEVVADFTSLVLLDVDLRAETSFAERVRGLQEQIQENASYAQYSTLSVLQDLRRANGGKRVAAPVVFACNLASPFVSPQVQAELGRWSWMLSQTPQVWLDHQVYRIGDGVQLAWDAVDELFPEGLMDEMLAAYERLLHRLADPELDWSHPASVK
ncbi:condensation domain-containing protein [Streptomyces sp. NPDC055607]